ncbi:pilus assembly protein [Bisgaard Taxon 10/6]|uniref:pilus assembly protein n=1 Tax=Exercitatus varius TaxID=67857 RepID=UPI00294B76AD|nr:pilus assembly protein [Exercitatus varius]MDG2957071.1 pilus assembly protein [Exercitatus varius]MDG2964739.1 pilus assembly protein [Exercitatus varius]
MLLLDKNKANPVGARKIVVLSDCAEMQNNVSQLLRTGGFENIEQLKRYFLSENIGFNAEDILGMIVDIKDETDIGLITKHINAIVPQNLWVCAIGTSDSITLAQNLANAGILYFHAGTQLHLMMDKISSAKVSLPHTRNTVKICVLGCKGGIGSSLISIHIANQIISNKKVPVLLAQGPNGSQDLDLAFDKKLQGDISKYDEYLDLFNGIPHKLNDKVTEKYNFIIYDQPIFNIDKDLYPEFFEYSNSFVLVVERRIASLRVAKQFLEQCERIRSRTNQAIRVFICISDHKPKSEKLMAKSDIETLLGTQVDAVIPFIKNTEAKTVMGLNLSKAHKKSFYSLAMKIIGVLSRNNLNNENKSLFIGLYRLLFNR